MPFRIVRQDIALFTADAIVNSAHPQPIVGGGVDAAIHLIAGLELIEARKRIGVIKPGEVAITKAFNLTAKFVIHTVGPIWIDGTHQEAEILHRCYQKSLEVAIENQCESIAFPLISSGAFRFPKEVALEIAFDTIRDFLKFHDLMVYLVVFDVDSFQLSSKKVNQVKQYIDDNYVGIQTAKSRFQMRSREYDKTDLEPYINNYRNNSIVVNPEKSFVEMLFFYIDQRHLNEVNVYKKANIDRKLFSKVRSNYAYQPKKATAIALAIGLELNLEETKDFIGRAGYALSPSSKFDLIIQYHLRNKIYDIDEINLVLFEMTQQTIGG